MPSPLPLPTLPLCKWHLVVLDFAMGQLRRYMLLAVLKAALRLALGMARVGDSGREIGMAVAVVMAEVRRVIGFRKTFLCA